MRFPNFIQKHITQFYYRNYESSDQLLSHFHRFKANETKSLDELRHIQRTLLKKILVHAQNHTVYYKRIFNEAGFNPERLKSIDDLKCLPILTKEILENNFEDLTASNLASSEYHLSYTGGTRGKKTKFLRDNTCRSKRIALQWRSDTWTGWDVYDKTAYIWPAFQDKHESHNWKHYLRENLFRRDKGFFTGILNEKIAKEIHHSLVKYKPISIRCFPTPAIYLAHFFIDHGLTVPSVKAVISTGEPLFDIDRELLAKGFKAEVFNLYASRESGTIASECFQHDSLHISIDSVAIEIDPDKRIPDVANEGNLLVTDLHNYAMPMIRYEIGDYGALSNDTCSCQLNLPLMKNIVGRVADGFWDPDHNFISPMALGDIMDECPYKKAQVQLIQDRNFNIMIKISEKSEPNDDMIQYFHTRLRQLFNDNIKIKHEIVKEITPESSGKYRFSISYIDEDDF